MKKLSVIIICLIGLIGCEEKVPDYWDTSKYKKVHGCDTVGVDIGCGFHYEKITDMEKEPTNKEKIQDLVREIEQYGVKVAVSDKPIDEPRSIWFENEHGMMCYVANPFKEPLESFEIPNNWSSELVVRLLKYKLWYCRKHSEYVNSRKPNKDLDFLKLPKVDTVWANYDKPAVVIGYHGMKNIQQSEAHYGGIRLYQSLDGLIKQAKAQGRLGISITLDGQQTYISFYPQKEEAK